MALKVGHRKQVSLQFGPNVRTFTDADIRSFEAAVGEPVEPYIHDGSMVKAAQETRWELTGTDESGSVTTVGFLPEHLIEN